MQQQAQKSVPSAARHGSTASTVVAGLSLFGAVLAALFYLNADSSSVESQPTDSTARVDRDSTPPKPIRSVQPKPAAVAPQQPVADANPTPSVELPPVVNSAIPRSAPEFLQAQLAAGEFGPAMETAKSEIDPARRAELIRKIARAQMKAQDFQGALMSIRLAGQLPNSEVGGVRAERATELALAGGAMGADFTELRDLIMNETSGEWEEVDGTGGTMSEFSTGVFVDPNGLMKELTQEERSGRLKALGARVRKAALNQDMSQSAPLRLVSLTRLEAAVARRLSRGLPVVESMKHLAGLSKVTHVFVYPEDGEIVIGGPAEAWQFNAAGLPVGVETGRPTLQLDDLVTVLRVFSTGGENVYQCLIKPTPQGLKNIQDFVARTSSRRLRPGQVRPWVEQLQSALGMQDVQVNGVANESRVARVIVEADYRMKMIGVDRLEGATGKDSYFDHLTAEERRAEKGNNSLAMRWWLTMKYDSVQHSPKKDVFEINGASVLCLSEDEFITRQGQRVHTGKTKGANHQFASHFTTHYAQLAKKDLVFADLQNIFDLSLVASLIQSQRLDRQTGWNVGTFGLGGSYQPQSYEVPRQVMTVANHRVYNGRDIIVQAAGGVEADFIKMLRLPKMLSMNRALASVARNGKAPKLPAGRWWWDAASE